MVEIRDAQPHPGAALRTAQRETHQSSQRERSDDRGQNRGAIAKPLTQILEANKKRVLHLKSVAQCAPRHPQEDVFEIWLNHAHTLGDGARVE